MHPALVSSKALMTEALFVWSGVGWDVHGTSFVERLSAVGVADRVAPRRVRVQARQIYCFAKAAHLGWYPDGAAIARKALGSLLVKAKSPDGRPGFVHILAPDGSVLNPLRDTYDHAFTLLALATVYQLDRDMRVRAEIDSLMHFIDTQLRSPDGGYVEGIPAAMPRRQNPQMHMFEAFIAAFDATHDPAFQQRAGDIFGLFVSNLFDAKTGMLGEYFEQDWSRIEPVSVEPGHQAEWVWLLKQFERITGCPTGKYRAVLLESALRYHDATGCLVDEGDVHGNVVKSTRRLWPQTEIIKAWLAQAESGVEGAADEARAALARLDKHYLQHPVKGGWYDQFDAEGNSLVDTIPASSFYHILCAVAEADRVLGAEAQ
ncbi:AGE family epimerase/isomerase [Tardiphaga sp.]|uniref:AGE family epimerase/isomerase n=1 Tax=Tardiphaga sp. TaxID=1926292 RepID=UPI0037DA43EF